MSDDEDKGTPSLEPPSLFGRKKKKAKQTSEPASPEAADPRRHDADIAPEVEPVPPPRAAAPPPTVGPPPAEESPTTILDADEPTVVQPASPPPPPLFADDPRVQPATPSPAPPAAPRSEKAPKPSRPPKERRAPRGPWLVGWAAAAVTGLLVGGLIVGGTTAALPLCEAVKGTESCGNPGFLLLVAILVIAGLVGALLLRAARCPQPGSTSFLAVGLLSVVALVMVDQLLEWWMAIVIPLVSLLTFELSHWVTTTYVEPTVLETIDDEKAPELHDIR